MCLLGPCYVGKVLRITAVGTVELLEPEVPGDSDYHAGGFFAEDGCVCLAHAIKHAGKVDVY